MCTMHVSLLKKSLSAGSPVGAIALRVFGELCGSTLYYRFIIMRSKRASHS